MRGMGYVIVCGVSSENTGIESWHGKTSGYSRHRCKCDPCMEAYRQFRRDSYQRNKAAVAARAKKWKDANREKVRKQSRDWAAENAERVKENQHRWRVANPEHHRAYNDAWRDANRERVNASQRRRRAVDPDRRRVAARAHYATNPRTEYQQAWRAANRDKLRLQTAQWRADNPERYRAFGRLSAARRRARERAALIVPFTQEQLLARMSYWGNRCYICRTPWQAIDHVKPLSKGGAHCLANFRPICVAHNSAKKAKWGGVSWIRSLTYSAVPAPA